MDSTAEAQMQTEIAAPVIANANDIDDATLKAAIIACRPFVYLDDLKKRVAERLGRPELFAPYSTPFGKRIYDLNEKVQREETQARIDSMGFEAASTELLESLAGRKVEMLMGVGGMWGESIVPGSIKPNGRGGFVFIPKGKRTKGYVPTFLRLATGDKAGLAASQVVVHQSA